MDEKKYRLTAAAGLFLPAEHAELLLALHDGDAALLYIWLLHTGETLDERRAAAQLGCGPEAVHAAAERLRSAGLLGESEKAAPPLPAEELPGYSAEEIVQRSWEDRAFQDLRREAESCLGHLLSRAETEKLLGIYSHLGLPCEVIMLLINHCAERTRKRYGEGRLPSMYAIEKEAYAWSRQEILTLEMAEEYLAALERREEGMAVLSRILQIAPRSPSATERKYMEEWLAMGFPMEALELAYDRTVVGTDKLVWKYMDRILRSWQEKGLRTVADIEEKDSRSAPRRATAAVSAAPTVIDDDLERLEQMMKEKR